MCARVSIGDSGLLACRSSGDLVGLRRIMDGDMDMDVTPLTDMDAFFDRDGEADLGEPKETAARLAALEDAVSDLSSRLDRFLAAIARARAT